MKGTGSPVKKFNFPLEKLQMWRQKQFEAEVVRLGQYQAEQESLRLKRLAMLREEELVLQAVRDLPAPSVEGMQAADNFRQWCYRESQRLNADEIEAAGRVARQRDVVLEARRGVEALEHLKERRLSQWKADVDKETEEMVSELVAARWAGQSAD
jgi:flagellar export protein FliJ